MSTNASPTNLEARLDSLEQRLRRQRALSVLLSLLGAVLVGWQFLPGPRVVDVDRLVIRDADRRVRGEWYTWKDGTVLMRLNDRAEEARVLILLGPDGGARLRMTDRDGANRLELALAPGGEPAVYLAGPDVRTRTRVGTLGGDLPALLVRDSTLETRWRAP